MAGASALDVVRDPAGRVISPAEQFAIVVGFLARTIEDQRLPERVSVTPPLGPAEKPPATEVAELPWPAFRDALLDVQGALTTHGQIPARVFAGAKKIAPADFLRAAASAASAAAAAGSGRPAFPAMVAIPTGTAVATERYVADDTPELFGGWIIHPDGFRAPRIVELAKLQAWTLKPAERTAR